MSTKKAPGRKATKRASTNDVLSDLARVVSDLKHPTMVSSEPMVGIQNISSYTVGLKSPFPNDEPDLQLAGPRYDPHAPTTVIADGNSVAQISHKWWLQLRRDNAVRKGMIVRNDEVLSAGTPRAPQDDPGTIPASAAVNAIVDPFVWIEEKTEPELIKAVESITAEESLRRVLTAVNQRIELERQTMKLPADGSLATTEGMEAEEKALRSLPWRYSKAEEIALNRLEEMVRRRDNQ